MGAKNVGTGIWEKVKPIDNQLSSFDSFDHITLRKKS
jgi:hypothetical protein